MFCLFKTYFTKYRQLKPKSRLECGRGNRHSSRSSDKTSHNIARGTQRTLTKGVQSTDIFTSKLKYTDTLQVDHGIYPHSSYKVIQADLLNLVPKSWFLVGNANCIGRSKGFTQQGEFVLNCGCYTDFLNLVVACITTALSGLVDMYKSPRSFCSCQGPCPGEPRSYNITFY